MIDVSALTKESIEKLNDFDDPKDKLEHLYGIVNDKEEKFSVENVVKHIKAYLSEQKFVEKTKDYVAEAMADLTVYDGKRLTITLRSKAYMKDWWKPFRTFWTIWSQTDRTSMMPCRRWRFCVSGETCSWQYSEYTLI